MKSRKVTVIGAHAGIDNVYTDRLLPDLVEAGWEVSFVGWDRTGAKPRRFKSQGIQYEMICQGWGYANKRLLLGLQHWFFAAVRYLFGLRGELVVALDLEAAFPAALARRMGGAPFVYGLLDQFALRPRTPTLLRQPVAWLDRKIIESALVVIVPDECRVLPGYSGLDADFRVIHNAAVDTPPRVSWAVGDDEPLRILTCGYIGRDRGIEQLIEATGNDARFEIVAMGRVRDAELARQLKQLNNISWLETRSHADALRVYTQCDVVFTYYDPSVPINRLAASNKWGDAMSAGIPIVVNSEIAKAPWLVGQGIAVSSPFEDVDELRTILYRLARNRDELKRMGKRAREVFDSGYSWANSLKAWDELLRDSLERLDPRTKL